MIKPPMRKPVALMKQTGMRSELTDDQLPPVLRVRQLCCWALLAGCAAVFIRDTLAPQLGVCVESVRADVKCKTDCRGLLGVPGIPPDLQNLEISVHIQSPDPKDKVQALYRTWLARCPVYLALTKPLSIKVTLTKTA
jgi:hypothetical protein